MRSNLLALALVPVFVSGYTGPHPRVFIRPDDLPAAVARMSRPPFKDWLYYLKAQSLAASARPQPEPTMAALLPASPAQGLLGMLTDSADACMWAWRGVNATVNAANNPRTPPFPGPDTGGMMCAHLDGNSERVIVPQVCLL